MGRGLSVMQRRLLEATDAAFPSALRFSDACELFHHDQTWDEFHQTWDKFMEELKAAPPPTAEGLQQVLNDKLLALEAEERKRLCTVAAVSSAFSRLERRGLVQRCGRFIHSKKLSVNKTLPPTPTSC
jgi:uncharacterized NAD(P)/FAD-binding protein YdhS